MIYNHGIERLRELVLYARGGNGRNMYKEGPRWISPGKNIQQVCSIAWARLSSQLGPVLKVSPRHLFVLS